MGDAPLPVPEVQPCPNCGEPSRGRATFCLRCGTGLPDSGSVYLPIPSRATAPEQASTPSGQRSLEESLYAQNPSQPEAPAALSAGNSAAILSMRALLGAPLAVVSMDVAGCITMLNSAAMQLFSVTEGDAVGRPYTAVFGDSLSGRLLKLFLQVAKANRSTSPKVLNARLPDGRRAVLRTSLGPLHDTAGGVLGVLFVAEEQQAPDPTIQSIEQQTSSGSSAQLSLGGVEPPDTLHATPDIEALEGGASLIDVGGVRQTITVLHADVRGSPFLAEVLEPEEIYALLLRYYSAAVAVLEHEGASVDHYVGNGILAVWREPDHPGGHARQAIVSGLQMQTAIRAVGSSLEYGVAIHTGEAIVYNLGSDPVPHYTAIGPAVDLAMVLQRAAPTGAVICSAATVAAAGEGIRHVAQAPLTDPQHQHPLEIYRVLGVEP